MTSGPGSSVPVVSVVVPAFNAAAYISPALQSVLAQTYRDIEVLVVDDASTDGTVAVVTALAAADRRIRLIRRATNGGPAAARNAGLAAAAGRYTAFLDADDTWLPDKLARQVAAFEAHPGAVLVCCNARWVRDGVEEGTVYDGCRVESGGEAWRGMLEDVFVGTPCAVVETATARALGGFDETLTVGEDQDLWLRLAFTGAVIALPEVLVRYQLRDDGHMARHRALAASLWLRRLRGIIEERRALLTPAEYHRILAAQCGRVGRNLYIQGQPGAGMALLREAVRHGASPFGIGLYLLRASPPARALKGWLRGAGRGHAAAPPAASGSD